MRALTPSTAAERVLYFASPLTVAWRSNLLPAKCLHLHNKLRVAPLSIRQA